MKVHNTPNRFFVWLPVILAALAMLFWPALASANCCCKRASQLSYISDANEPSCCQDSVVSCCAEHAGLSSETLSCDVQSKGCQCAFDCCKAHPRRLQTTVEDFDWQPVSFAAVTPAVDSPYRIASIDVYPVWRSSFLLAQDHCAQICCWLK